MQNYTKKYLFNILKIYVNFKQKDLKVANNLSNAHIYIFNKKINVILASQTINIIVADSIEKNLRKIKISGLKNSHGITEFIRIFDEC